MTYPTHITPVHRVDARTDEPRREVIADHLKPRVPDALSDGRIPLPATDPYLVVHAPIVDLVGYVSDPGDLFQASIDGVGLPETEVAYAGGDATYVELKIAKWRIDALEEGPHALSYFARPVPVGPIVRCGRTLIEIDRTPAGGRYLPRIAFSEDVVFEGLSLIKLLSLPEATLVGTIPDYADIYPSDVIHAFIKHRDNGVEVSAGQYSASTDGSPMVIRYDRSMLDKIEDAGRVDFYYQVVDAVGLTSKKSSSTPLNLSIKNAPDQLDPPTIVRSVDGFVGDVAIRPELWVDIPPTDPQARIGDTIQLFIGDKSLPPVEVEDADLDQPQLKRFSIGYASSRKMFEGEAEAPFKRSIHYIHRRRGVASISKHNSYVFELALPGGWDPVPDTGENEALAPPILRGASGAEDNVIDFGDSSLPATVHINRPSANLRASSGLEDGDKITLMIGANEVGEPHVFREGDFPLALTVPASDLNANAGPGYLSYSVSRELATKPHVATSRSPLQPIRIDSADALPGAGKPIAAPIFTSARINEQESGSYGLTIFDFTDGSTTLRILGYVNMNEGDTISFKYDGFDMYDGGDPVAGTSGTIEHIVRAIDVLAKDVPDPVTGDFVYLDLRFPLEPARALSHGHFECSHTIKNAAGSVTSPNTNVLIKIRF